MIRGQQSGMMESRMTQSVLEILRRGSRFSLSPAFGSRSVITFGAGLG